MNLQNQIDYLHGVIGVDMFDDCTVPNGLNMERVRGAIVMRCGLLTPLYSEPEVQRNATQQFFYENQWNFDHVLKIIKAEYSPIENVFEDRTETENINRTHEDTTDYGKTITTSGNENTRTENKISAENGSTYSPDTERTENTMDSSTHTESGQDARSGAGTEGRRFNMNRHGNVGTVSANKLINEELDLLERFNPYKFIADLYEKELIIGLY